MMRSDKVSAWFGVLLAIDHFPIDWSDFWVEGAQGSHNPIE